MKQETQKIILRWSFILIFYLLIFGVGWAGNFIYRGYTNQRTYDGLWLSGYNKTDANNEAYNKDILGEWVCVNINGMSYKRAIEVINHEVGHEMFAEECEKNISKCMEIIGK